MELRPFFTRILAWTTCVHFSNPGAKNPCLDAILRDFPYGTSGIRLLQSNESLMKTNQYYETKYQWLGLFSSRQAQLNCIPFDLGIFPRNILLNFVATDVYALCVGHFPTNLRINLLNFVATDVYAFLCWTFSHKFTHYFVKFCCDKHLHTFVKILS